MTVGYAALMAVLGTGVFLAPGLTALWWSAIGAITVAAILYGTWQHAPYSRTPWWLLASAVAAMSAGDALYAVGDGGGPVGTVANGSYLFMIPLVAAGMLGMTRSSVVLADRSRMLDLLTFSCAAALAAWVTVLGPAFTTARLSTGERFVLTTFILAGLLMLIITVRLAVAARLSWSVAMLVGGAGALLIGDVLYALAELDGGWRAGDPGEIAYLLFYFSWGASALHPSMSALTDPVDTWPTRLHVRSAALLTTSLAVPSGLLFVEEAAGVVQDAALIGVASLIMLFLVLIRLTDAIAQYRRSLVRERALREASCALVAATDPDRVLAAARTAVGTLLPSGHPYEVLVAEAGASPLPPMPAERRTRLIGTALLPPSTAGDVTAYEAALVCPLGVDGRPAGGGALLVAGSRLDLLTIRNAIEVLATQAALALERISLTETMNRRDGDRYLRTVVRNATDVVLVVEPGGQIRYASPSLARVVDVDPACLPSLLDLVDPADHQRLAETLRTADADGVHDVWNMRRAEGPPATVEVTCRDLRGDRMVRGYVITLRDVTKRRQQEQERIRQVLEASPGGQNRQSSTTKYR